MIDEKLQRLYANNSESASDPGIDDKHLDAAIEALKDYHKNQEYVDNQGMECPACGGPPAMAGELEALLDTAWQNCSCDDCGATWTDVFELTGYRDLIPQGGL